MKFIPGCCILLIMAASATAQSAMPAIRGWKQQAQNGRYDFSPNTLLNAEFTYTVLPLIPGDHRAIGDWLPAAAISDLATAGYTVSEDVMARKGKIQSFITWSAIVEDKLARRMAVSYMAYRKDSATIRYGKVMTVTNGANQTYLNAAVQHFIDLSKQEGMITDKKLKEPKRHR